MNKVLLVGFDGATFDIAQPLINEGRLPNLAKMQKEGAWGVLESVIPPITPTAWTSVFTGKNPGKHGIYDFHELDPQTYDMRPVRNDRHREKTLWQLLGDADKKSIVVDVPYTYPPQPLQGMMITGLGTPRTEGTVFTYPEDLAEQLPTNLRSDVRVAFPQHRFDRSPEFIGEWDELMAGRRRLLKHLITQEDWDFFFTVFTITDNLAHVFWTYVEPTHPNYHKPEAETYRAAFFRAYEQCDALLGDLMSWAGSNVTTLVMSDHGFGSIYPRQYMFRKLAEAGYVRFQSPPLFSAIGQHIQKAAMRTYTGLPFVREWVKGMRPQQQKRMKGALRRTGMMPSMKSVDYQRSTIIPSSFSLQLWVNSDDRFRNGSVPQDDRSGIIDEVTDYVLALRDVQTEQAVVSNVYKGSQIYQGPAVERSPDLLLDYTNFYDPAAGPQASNAQLEGGHTIKGIFFAHGDYIEQQQLSRSNLTDLAPTILHLQGLPIPPDMDGSVLESMFRVDFMKEHPVQAGTVPARIDKETLPVDSDFTREEQAEIETQLRQLGYID